MINAFICEGLRTPIGRFGGALASIRTDDLAAVPIRALLEQNPAIDPAAIDEVILGCANQAGEDNRNVARMAALLAGLPTSVPGSTINRLCASGADAVGYAARAIMSGQIDFAIAGGVESMSRAPFVIGKAETAWSRSASIEDTTIGWRFINPVMKKTHGVDSMPETAENVAVMHGVSREEQDAFALRSQQLAAKAQQQGFFSEEITPVTITAKKSETAVSMDEHPRANTTPESLSGLRPVVREGGTVTAGNASGVNDGSAAMFIASESAVKRHGLKPRARFLGMATAGVPPKVMGIGPAPASEKLMQRLGLGIDDFDLIELNEAFASQVIASLRKLHVDPFSEKVNPHGGAIALGHPLGMSGARLVLTAARALEQRGGNRALITMCIGVGQGLAIAIERV
ncbi:3-oxoadipyl-CoA thiolase [Rhizorhabdus dicambivorans]|uniref:Beta-ketoadipyl-CoA thiolase n=1 Tax=Rhizorhabdus dicambivorans TaxID=1850238 RepID=A0A2A4FPT9_9SPHN|nr:3-oxoadipyl-CoA thiolase [Rhizorhabdus dicambivorans]ATE67219.1 3-oxoadipyl-CoA thiolase [Rhizorhabdus dicambivorans]PCE39720.1 3-oxoadipyl-CoA thiolase [Rhizorhabdus dicambivorans]